MSGIQTQKPIDVAKQKVDNVKNFEGNKNGKIDTREEVQMLSVFLADNSDTLSTNQIDYLKVEIQKGEKAVAKEEEKVKKQQEKETAAQLGDLGKRIAELTDENGFVTKAGAEELLGLLKYGALTEFQEQHVKGIIKNSGFENSLNADFKEEKPKESAQQPADTVSQETVPSGQTTPDSAEYTSAKDATSSEPVNGAKTESTTNTPAKTTNAAPARPHNIKVKYQDYAQGKQLASDADLCVKYQRYVRGLNEGHNAAKQMASYLGQINSKNAFGFFENLSGNYCKETMFALNDPNNNIRYDVISGPIRALLTQARSAGLQNTQEYKDVDKALQAARTEVAKNDKEVHSNRRSGDLSSFAADNLDQAINKLVKIMGKYLTVE